MLWLNGRLMPRDQAHIDPADRGFLLADGLFETIRAYRGHLFRFEDHLQRLAAGAAEIGIPLPVDPTAIADVTLAGINIPIRIGEVTVMPGDIVLGTPTGVIFIPAHLAQEVVERSEAIRVRDDFGKQRLAEGRYTSGEIDVPTWREDIEADFQEWLKARG